MVFINPSSINRFNVGYVTPSRLAAPDILYMSGFISFIRRPFIILMP